MTDLAPPAPDAAPPAEPTETGAAGAAAVVTAGNVASRVTGLLRVLAIGGALGTTFAGNTYQSANLVSNVLFELLAAGLLSSVLVPPFVRLFDGGRADEAERLAGAVLGLALAVLGAVTVVGIAARPWIMRLLTVAVEDPGVRRQEVVLGSFLLVLFLPQLLFYAVGSIATGLLHGRRRFAAAAFAPVANNVLVVATMATFWALHRTRPGLDLSTAEKLVLGLGTTAGVVAMSAVPLVALRRAGLRLRPRWDPAQPGLRRLGRDGAWAMGLVAGAQILLVTTLVLANRVEGGVVAYHIAFQIFLLPFAVLGHPVLTALFPRLASAASGQRWRQFSGQLGRGAAAIAFFLLPASALLAVLADPALALLRLGALDAAGAELVATLVTAYAVGLIGYAMFQYLARASYAADDTRAPGLVALVTAAGGAAAMAAGFTLTESAGHSRLAAVGYGHSAAFLAAAVVLGWLLRRRVPEPWPIAAPLARSLGSALAAGAAAVAVASLLPDPDQG